MKLSSNSVRLYVFSTLIFTPLFFMSGCDVSDSTQVKNDPQATDPIVADFPIVYIERPIPIDEDGNPIPSDVFDQTAFNPGARLILKDRASSSAKETVITEGIFDNLEVDPETGEEISLYDVKDLEVSADGSKLIFAMRAPEIEGLDEDEQPTWNIWEYDFESSEPQPQRIISSAFPIKAEQGQDVAPHYLPNGNIVFSSTRQSRTVAILLDEGKPQYSGLDDKRNDEAMVLHTMEDDGTKITQITFNASHDMQPTVLSSGEILFLRWDAMNRHDQLSLYKSNPDGSNVQLYYGFHSQETGTNDTEGVYLQPRELPDGRIMVALQPRSTLRLGGDVVAIDGQNFIANDQPTRANSGASGPAQESLITFAVDTSGEEASRGGYFSSAFPLDDGTERLLVSWSQCRLIDPETELNAPCTDELIELQAEQAAPLFGLWIYSTIGGTQLPIKLPQADVMYTDAVVLSPKSIMPIDLRPTPEDPTFTDTLVSEHVGVLHIRSVYDIDGLDTAPGGSEAMADPTQTPVSDRPARFLRIIKNVPMPDDDVLDFDNSIFGRSQAQRMRDIVGYVPVEPDGSAKFKVPSDIPFMVDILDGNGRRINPRHENWMYVQSGEERECTGCHTSDSVLPHGRLDAEATSINDGALGGEQFPGTQILDPFGTPELSPEFAPVSEETMAEYYARLYGPRTPSVDLNFTDNWTDPSLASPGDDISWRYVAITASANANPRDSLCPPLETAPQQWPAPTTCVATGSWTSLCRITINYPDNIQPLWTADRRSCSVDTDGNASVTTDLTCTSCHSRTDGETGDIKAPDGQLELTGEVSADRNDYITSYAELMFQDNEQELVDGSLTDVVLEVPTGEFERLPPEDGEEEGELILDEDGNPIEIIDLVTVSLPVPLSTNSARSSNRFFSRFDLGGSHAGYLSQDELKLISEWLDIGGQYYNNPFAAPAN